MTLAPDPAPTPVNLDHNQFGTLIGWTVILLLATGILVLLVRVTLEGTPKRQLPDKITDKTLIRSWMAVALTSGLLLFAACSFFIADTALRNLLMGGVIASTGTVTAFYFASKSAEQTQQNLLNAAFRDPRPAQNTAQNGAKTPDAGNPAQPPKN